MKLEEKTIKQTFGLFRDYVRWMYTSPDGIESFEKSVRTEKGRSWTMGVNPDGRLTINIVDGPSAIYEAYIVTASPPKGAPKLDIVEYKLRIVNKLDLSEQDEAYFSEMGMYVLSFFQRLNAFTFFARLSDETIDQISRDLGKVELS